MYRCSELAVYFYFCKNWFKYRLTEQLGRSALGALYVVGCVRFAIRVAGSVESRFFGTQMSTRHCNGRAGVRSPFSTFQISHRTVLFFLYLEYCSKTNVLCQETMKQTNFVIFLKQLSLTRRPFRQKAFD